LSVNRRDAVTPTELVVSGVYDADRRPGPSLVYSLRRILQASDGISARIFRMLNDVAIEAIETGMERIADEALEHYKPVGEDKATFQ
jgi:hypothetical protein